MGRKRQKKLSTLEFGDDRISALSDDILLSIISRLPFIEASATTLLSTRWRHLHTYLPRLDFPPLPLKPPINLDNVHLAKLRFRHYVNMIDRTLDSNRAHRVQELKVNTYYMNGANLQKWLLFAFTRETQIIEINLTRVCAIPRTEHPDYFLGLANLISWQPAAAAGLECLKELSLCLIKVTDHDLELLLSNCLALESLSIQYCGRLRRVSIVGHPNLKHLDLSHSWIHESFEIRDVINLVSLKCFIKPDCAVKLENIPKLIEFSSGEFLHGILWVLFDKLPSCVRDQLQLLHLSTRLNMSRLVHPFEFANTKYLELEVDRYRETSKLTHRLPRLIEACPSLEKLVIKTSRERLPPEYKKSKLPRNFEELPLRLSLERMPPCRVKEYKKLSSDLKEFEITGYLRSSSVLGLATYLINNAAASLQRVIVVPWDSSYTNRMRAHHDFQSITPTSVNLEIKNLMN